MVKARRGYILVSIGAALALALSACRAPSDKVTSLWRTSNVTLDSLLGRLSEAPSQEAFDAARVAYNRVEFLWAYDRPLIAQRLNGPPVTEVERDCEHTQVPPSGFQVLEAGMFPSVSMPRDTILKLVSAMRAWVREGLDLKPIWSDSSLLDAARQELFMLAFTGTSDYDSPVARHSRAETHGADRGSRRGGARRLRQRPLLI